MMSQVLSVLLAVFAANRRFIYFFLIVPVVVKACPYSHLSPQHTMCVFRPRACPGKRLMRSGGLSLDEKKDIVLVHNELRQSVALGIIPGQPPADNMKEMFWDEELAAIAQRWADQCGRHHDKERNVGRFRVGQNVAATWSLSREPPSGDQPEFKRHIEAWFDEVKHFSPTHIRPFVFTKKLGHYTQLAWADTSLVGCGYTYFREADRGYTKMYVCNYGPAGNVIGDVMYEELLLDNQGPCHGHQYLRPSRNFLGLCVERSVGHKTLEGGHNAVEEETQSNRLPAMKMMSTVMKHSAKTIMNFARTFNPFNLFRNFA